MTVLTIGLLGSLRIETGGRPVELTAGRLRSLLAALAISPGRAVSVDRLAAIVWGDDPPEDVRRSLQTCVVRLRKTLGPERIARRDAGYVLDVRPDDVDTERFGRLLSEAARSGDPGAEYASLTEALAMWRGEPFEGIGSEWLERTERPRLQERYLAAVERRIDLDIAAGRHARLAGELEELTARHPLREPLWLRLLVVLDRLGRSAEALHRYERARTTIAGVLGTDPSGELRQAYADLLAGRRPAGVRYPEPARPARAAVIPRQLPVGTVGFTGRADALAALNALLRGPGPAGRTVAVGGTAGVGKTSLALHWAHRAAGAFPDGQLYVNLRGFDPGGSATDPAEALRGFLSALGVPPAEIPPGLDELTGWYRRLLTGRRVLVVLDNARDAGQVRPLLPAVPGCLAVVTSRDRLPGLDAVAVPLDLPTAAEAREFLAGRIGRDRIAAEPGAVDEIIAACARLPLALAIAAARAATRPGLPLRALAADLREAGGGLDAFEAGDPTTDVRAVFSWSYRTLSAPAARLFRLLGLHPGPDTGVAAAASLAGVPVDEALTLLGELRRAHLIAEHAPGRHVFHDLLRAYAAELAASRDTDAERRAAVHRLLDHHLHSAYIAARTLYPSKDAIVVPVPRTGAVVVRPRDYAEALAWVTAEYECLMATVRHAASTGWDGHTWRLGWTLTDYQYLHGHWRDRFVAAGLALKAAARTGDHTAQARAHRFLAQAEARLGRFDEARAHLDRSLALAERMGDRLGQAQTHHVLANWCEYVGRTEEALGHAERTLALYRAAGYRVGVASALNAVGWYSTLNGDHRRAVRYCRRAIAALRDLGDTYELSVTWDSLGHAHHRLGDHGEAIACYRTAADLHRELGNRSYEGGTLVELGDAYEDAGDSGAARDAWKHALGILEDLGHADAEKVRAKLAGERRG